MNNLSEHYIAKIEGHGTLHINFAKNRAELRVEEGERLFEGLVLGRPYYDAPFITSRICGVCPIVHNLCSIAALENALKIKVDPITKKLRKLMLCAQIIQSHTLHLYFLALADYLGKKSSLDLTKTNPREFQIGLKLKKTADYLADCVAGRNVHPVTTTIGGFLKIPTKNDLRKIQEELKTIIEAGIYTVQLFASFVYPPLNNPTAYLSLAKRKEYAVDGKTVESSSSDGFKPEKYQKNIKEFLQPYSTAKYAKYKEKSMIVGAIARLSLHQHLLNPLAKAELRKAVKKLGPFPTFNSFHNNFAQAVEILHFTEEAILIINKLIRDNKYKIRNTKYQIRAGQGIGSLEAPRGTLYHYYELDKFGKIINCDIITPTVQNLSNIESDAKKILELSKNEPAKKRAHYLEVLIRAYDPCITCSVH